MAKIESEVRDCLDCPHCRGERMYTEDSFEEPFNYFCKATAEREADQKQIATYIEWRKEMPEIPDWCPCKPGAKPIEKKKGPETTKVVDVKIGELVHVVNKEGRYDSAGPFLKTAHSLIDNRGSNWYLGECKDLDTVPASPTDLTLDQANEFRYQVSDGSIFKKADLDD